MTGEHKLTQHDKWFLDLGKKDPVTGKVFEIGDVIVVCATCKSPHLKDTWEMMGYCSVRPSHKNTTQEFNPAMFQRTSKTQGFIIKDPMKTPLSAKFGRFNWYKIITAVTVLLLIVLSYMTLAIESNRTILASSADEALFTVDKKLDLVESKLRHIELSEKSERTVHLMTDTYRNLLTRIENKIASMPMVHITFRIIDVRNKLSYLWEKGAEGLQMIFDYIESRLVREESFAIWP